MRHIIISLLFGSMVSCTFRNEIRAPESTGKFEPHRLKILSNRGHGVRQSNDSDCGIASLEYAASIWGVDVSASIKQEDRDYPSSLNSLAQIAKDNGLNAYVLQAGSATISSLEEINAHLHQERPVILLIKIPSNLANMVKYARSDFSTIELPEENWLSHFVVLSSIHKSENHGKNRYDMMDPSYGEIKTISPNWLYLFWIRQGAKYLLIGKDEQSSHDAWMSRIIGPRAV